METSTRLFKRFSTLARPSLSRSTKSCVSSRTPGPSSFHSVQHAQVMSGHFPLSKRIGVQYMTANSQDVPDQYFGNMLDILFRPGFDLHSLPSFEDIPWTALWREGIARASLLGVELIGSSGHKLGSVMDEAYCERFVNCRQYLRVL